MVEGTGTTYNGLWEQPWETKKGVWSSAPAFRGSRHAPERARSSSGGCLLHGALGWAVDYKGTEGLGSLLVWGLRGSVEAGGTWPVAPRLKAPLLNRWAGPCLMQGPWASRLLAHSRWPVGGMERRTWVNSFYYLATGGPGLPLTLPLSTQQASNSTGRKEKGLIWGPDVQRDRPYHASAFLGLKKVSSGEIPAEVGEIA